MLKDKINYMLAISGKKKNKLAQKLGISESRLYQNFANNTMRLQTLLALVKETNSELIIRHESGVEIPITLDDVN